MVFQTLRASAVNHKKHGGAFSFKSKKLRNVTGGGLGDNPTGYRILLDRGWIEERRALSLRWPESTELDSDNCPIGIFPTEKLLCDLERHLGIETGAAPELASGAASE